MGSTTGFMPIEELSANVLETSFDNFDQFTVENAKMRIIDVVGCLIGGADASGNRELIDLVRNWGGKQEATILVYGGKIPAHDAAMVNSIMARSLDFGAIHPLVDGRGVPGHVSETTVPTAITMGEAMDTTGKEVITALLVGDDIACRVLAGSSYDMGQRWDCTGTVNAIGATAIAGRILGLNNRQMKNAFGIVLNQLGGSFQIIWDATTSFKLPQGLSAKNGIFSAELAKVGWTGPDDALLSKCGYYELYTGGCTNPEALIKDLGRKYYSDSTFKPYPCCRGTHAGIESALALIRKFEIKAEDIEEITLRLSRRDLDIYYGKPFRIGEFPHANAIFSCVYTVANALLRGSVKPEHFSEESIRHPQITALMDKVKLAELPGASELSTEVSVRMTDGREFSEFTDTPKGSNVANPMSKDEIVGKFRDNVDFSRTVTREHGEKLLDLLGNLEELDGMGQIVELLLA